MYFLLLVLALAGGSLAADNERLCLIKRGPFFQQITPCTCPTGRETIIDLGRNHVPRYLANFNCETVPCYRPPFICAGLPYKVKVLKRRNNTDDIDMSVPESLRAGWKHVSVRINVGCVCHENENENENSIDSNIMKRSVPRRG